MRLDNHFAKLNENISLDDTRRKRVESAYVAVVQRQRALDTEGVKVVCSFD